METNVSENDGNLMGKKPVSRERVYIIYEIENKNELGNRFFSTIYLDLFISVGQNVEWGQQ